MSIENTSQRIAADYIAALDESELQAFVAAARAIPHPDPETIASRQGLTDHLRNRLEGTPQRAGQAGLTHGGGTGLNENRLTSGLASLLGPNTTINGQDQ